MALYDFISVQNICVTRDILIHAIYEKFEEQSYIMSNFISKEPAQGRERALVSKICPEKIF